METFQWSWRGLNKIWLGPNFSKYLKLAKYPEFDFPVRVYPQKILQFLLFFKQMIRAQNVESNFRGNSVKFFDVCQFALFLWD